MNTIVEIDKAGRIVVPKKLRDALHLTPGTRIKVAQSGGTLVFEPDFPEARLVIEDGIPLIYPADHPPAAPLSNETVIDVIERGRLEREHRILGLDSEEYRQEVLTKETA